MPDESRDVGQEVAGNPDHRHPSRTHRYVPHPGREIANTRRDKVSRRGQAEAWTAGFEPAAGARSTLSPDGELTTFDPRGSGGAGPGDAQDRGDGRRHAEGPRHAHSGAGAVLPTRRLPSGRERPEPEELANLRRVTDELVRRHMPSGARRRLRPRADPHAQAPRVRRIKTPHTGIRLPRHRDQPEDPDDPAAAGRPRRPVRHPKLNMKAAGYGAAVEWHQDGPSTRTPTTISAPSG